MAAAERSTILRFPLKPETRIINPRNWRKEDHPNVESIYRRHLERIPRPRSAEMEILLELISLEPKTRTKVFRRLAARLFDGERGQGVLDAFNALCGY